MTGPACRPARGESTRAPCRRSHRQTGRSRAPSRQFDASAPLFLMEMDSRETANHTATTSRTLDPTTGPGYGRPSSFGPFVSFGSFGSRAFGSFGRGRIAVLENWGLGFGISL